MKLNQVIAIEKQVKNRTNAAITEAYQAIQKAEPMRGISRVYSPKDDEGEKLPPEGTKVQWTAQDAITKVSTALTELVDTVAHKDHGNLQATADVIVDGQSLLTKVPVPTLLFLEKQLTDLRTFVSKLPTLDLGERWAFDATQNCYASEPKGTTRTKKIPRNHVKAEATDKHPAQVEVYHEDVIVGYWTTTHYSGALPVREVADMLNRVDVLLKAVKTAREEANMIDVGKTPQLGEALLRYVFAGK